MEALVLLSSIYGGRISRHRDLFDISAAHRKVHGETCTVYASSPTNAPLWPLLAAMLGARRFLELGTGLGYTAALIAEAGGPGSLVDTVEAVAEHADLAEQELARRGLLDRVHVRRGQARDILPQLVDPYHVVFVDADWEEYPAFLPHLLRLTQPGGVLVTGNLFPLFEPWAKSLSGKDAIEEYLRRLLDQPQLRTFIVPGLWKALSYRMRES